MNKINKWWMAGTGALILGAALGVGAVMAQEATPSPGATTTPQDAPAAQETPEATPQDGSGEVQPARPTGGCGGKLVDKEALAAFLGVDAAQLREELAADGATLATVAASHGQDRNTLIAFLTSQAQERVAAKVADGSLTQAEADAKLAEFTANVDELIDSDAPIGRGFHRGFEGDAPDADSSSDSSVS